MKIHFEVFEEEETVIFLLRNGGHTTRLGWPGVSVSVFRKRGKGRSG